MSRAPASCPIDYHYGARALDRAPDFSAGTLYVVGGLYGNPEALEAVLEMKAREERTGGPVRLVFNGDFNWFDADPATFGQVNQAVLEHDAIQGNVEAELSREGDHGDCGCAYPAYVDDGTAERSNEIFVRLRETAGGFPGVLRALGALPKHLVAGVGGRRVAILHGDPDSLAGWSLAAEAVGPAPDGSGAPLTPLKRIEGFFRDAGSDAFATAHTCLAFARDFTLEGMAGIDGGTRLIFNNGAAGMPNFRGTSFGLLTRISESPKPPPESLYGQVLNGVRYDALPVFYDQERWVRRFLRDWPEDSPAHRSYAGRILHGPDYTPAQAARGAIRLDRSRRTA